MRYSTSSYARACLRRGWFSVSVLSVHQRFAGVINETGEPCSTWTLNQLPVPPRARPTNTYRTVSHHSPSSAFFLDERHAGVRSKEPRQNHNAEVDSPTT